MFLQYPQGLGSTVKELDISKAKAVVSKTKFSMLTDEVREVLKGLDRKVETVILCGIEVSIIAHKL